MGCGTQKPMPTIGVRRCMVQSGAMTMYIPAEKTSCAVGVWWDSGNSWRSDAAAIGIDLPQALGRFGTPWPVATLVSL